MKRKAVSRRTLGSLRRNATHEKSSSGFDEYQQRASDTIHGQQDGQRRQIASMLGLASETGSILDCYKRYLRDSIDLSASREFLAEELGDLLWYIAAVATACKLKLGNVAVENLRRTKMLYGHSPKLELPSGSQADDQSLGEAESGSSIRRHFSEYQRKASATSQLSLRGPDGPLAPMFGLGSAMGSVLDFPKRNSRNLDISKHKKVFLQELGDLLWYTSAVATSCELDLGEIAERNLARASDLYRLLSKSAADLFASLPIFDGSSRPTERFPRLMIIRFEERSGKGGPTVARQTVIKAEPYAFPAGPFKAKGGKWQGFKIDVPLGQDITDNSRRRDGYRYHDAIHLAFVAVLGWSPTIRGLLRLKRKSEPEIDRNEDGARAIFTEEGLAAILSRLAPRRMGFQGENTVDGQVIAMAQAAAQDLEARELPGWLWRRAICQGFRAMHELDQNKGGYLKVDLDNRELTYSKMVPYV